MGRVERRVARGKDRGRMRGEESESEQEEVIQIIKRLINEKAVGMNGISGKAWKYEEEELENWVWRVCKRVWEGKGRPED